MIKTKRNAGETLVEALIAILICVLAALTVSTAIVKSAKLSAQGNEGLSAYYEKNNDLTEQKNADAEGTLSVQKNGSKTALLPNGQTDYETEYFINGELGGDDVVSYKVK